MNKGLLIFIFYFVSVVIAQSQIVTDAPKRVRDSLVQKISTSTGKEKVDALNSLSTVVAQHYPDSCQLLAEMALKIAEDLNYIRGKASSLYNIGNAHYFRNDITKALPLYMESYQYYLNSDIPKSNELGEILLQLKSIYQYLGDYDEHLKYLKLAEECYSSLGNKKGTLFAQWWIGFGFFY